MQTMLRKFRFWLIFWRNVVFTDSYFNILMYLYISLWYQILFLLKLDYILRDSNPCKCLAVYSPYDTAIASYLLLKQNSDD